MSGIHVLSEILKGGNKLEKTSTPKGKDVSDSPENVAAVFAAMLSGFMNSNVDSKGQNSSIAGQESEEKQSTGNPEQSVQNPIEQGSMLGYGNFALTNLFQPMLQSNLPAGKEANSGNDVSQGTGSLANTNAKLTSIASIVSGNNFELDMLNFTPLVSDEVFTPTGMTTLKPQGVNPGITELDKYRQVIANLLVALSGEITDTSPKENRLSLEGLGTMDLRQEMAKIVQGWMTVTEDVAEGEQATGQATKSVEITKALQEGGARMGISTTGVKDLRQDMVKIVEGWMAASSEVAKSGYASSGNASSGNVTGGQVKANSSLTQVIDRLLSPEGSGPKVTRQDMAKAVEGWMTVADEGAKDGQALSGKKAVQPLLDALITGIGSRNPELNAKAATLVAALNSLLSQEVKGAKTPQGVNGKLDAEVGIINPAAKGSSELHVQQKSEVMGLQGNKTSNLFQGAFREEVQKGNSMLSTELSGVKDVQNLNSNAGMGVANNLVAVNVADGKTIAVPVWEQISTVIREQVMNRSQELKQLDIQLHPADLGKIQIGMRWENGQVHLVVQASEAATGQLLQNQLSDLRQNLTNQGVNCGMLQMGQGGDRQQNPRENESQRTFNQNTDPNEGEDQSVVFNSLTIGQGEINRINVTA